ncbi:hypothetical protein [Aeromonas sobria]|nr:hypothetical protein [Aeromonas sobria]
MKEVTCRWVDRYLIHLTLSEKCHVALSKILIAILAALMALSSTK